MMLGNDEFAAKRFATLDGLRNLLDRLAEDADLIAPVDVEGHILYRPVDSSDDVLFDYERTEMSAKEYILPATETFLRIEQRGKEAEVTEILPDRKQIIFGVRPCDAHGFAVLDALFLDEDPVDQIYRHHRERTVLIGMACPEMWEGCFCVSVGGGPTDATHLDVLIRQAEGGYLVEPMTPKGVSALKDLGAETPKEPQSVGNYAKPVPVTPPETWRALFESEIWKRHGERCLSCRICTYVCPTCRCFDVTDRVVDVKPGLTRVERIRVWDACTSANYRRVAGGHNPRATKPDRLRNRFYCKFCYYPEDFGPKGCVGCGRCIVSCPVDIDITDVMRDVARQ